MTLGLNAARRAALCAARCAVSVACALAATVSVAVAAPSEEPSPIPVPTAPASRTHHRVAVGGTTLRYVATAERIVVLDKSDKPAVAMFATSYELAGAAHARRPVTFLWNGGPGSSSLWLHMGSFAPYRVATNGTGAIVPPSHLVPNDGTLLDSTDLVFIDAPGTGYSRLVGTAKKDDYYGVDQDARAFTQFIERWLTAHDRWGSPKFLIGESYGTTRAANVVDRLQSDGVGVNGVVLVSSALDLTALDPGLPGDDRSYVAFLPTETAVAWYRAPAASRAPSLTALLDDARAFASGPYAAALIRGDDVDAETRTRVADELHRFTGLDRAYIERANLRIDPGRFEKELERGAGALVGRLDGRFTGYDVDRNADSPSYDPTLDAGIQDAFVSEFNRYVRDDLRFATNDRYLPTNYSEVGNVWKLERDAADAGFPNVQLPNVLPDLAQAIAHDPSLRVLSANGYFDLATPFYGTELDLAHLGLSPALAAHVRITHYPSGHMIYLEDASRRALRADIEKLIHDAE